MGLIRGHPEPGLLDTERLRVGTLGGVPSVLPRAPLTGHWSSSSAPLETRRHWLPYRRSPAEAKRVLKPQRTTQAEVEAAGRLPPRKTFTEPLAQGADLVAISGGKYPMGPQTTGLILSRKELIEACLLNSSPNKA
jgi:hypothetical protein